LGAGLRTGGELTRCRVERRVFGFGADLGRGTRKAEWVSDAGKRLRPASDDAGIPRAVAEGADQHGRITTAAAEPRIAVPTRKSENLLAFTAVAAALACRLPTGVRPAPAPPATGTRTPCGRLPQRHAVARSGALRGGSLNVARDWEQRADTADCASSGTVVFRGTSTTTQSPRGLWPFVLLDGKAFRCPRKQAEGLGQCGITRAPWGCPGRGWTGGTGASGPASPAGLAGHHRLYPGDQVEQGRRGNT